MATQQDVLQRMDEAATNAEHATDAYLEVLKTEGEQDINLPDGTTTPNLNKRLASVAQAVKSVNGRVGDVEVTREDLGIPSDEILARQEKEARFVITSSGRTQEQKNKENPSPFDFKAKGDGVTNDTQAFIDLEVEYQGKIIDLFGKTYLVTRDFNNNRYVNGYLKVSNLIIDKKLHSNINLNKVRVERDFKSFFADSLPICEQYGYARLFPQGFFIDVAHDQIFIFCNREVASDTKNNWGWTFAYQYSTGQFISAFAGIPTSWVEGAFVTVYESNRYLIAPFSETTGKTTNSNAFSENGLGVFRLPNDLKAIHNTLVVPEKTVMKVGDEYLGTNRILLNGTDVYVIKSSTKVNGSQQSGFIFKLDDIMMNDSPKMAGSFYYPEVSTQAKAQGCALGRYFYGVNYGRNTGPTYINGEFDAKNHGVVLYAKNGAVVNSSFFDHKKYSDRILTHVDKLVGFAYSGNLESEGLQFVSRGDADVINVLEVATFNIVGSLTQGCHPIIITYDSTYSDSEDMSDIASEAHTRSFGENSNKVVSTTQPKNPFTFESFTTISEIANYAIGAGLSEYSFYHSNPKIKDVDGLDFPAYAWVTLTLNNFSTMFLKVQGSINYTRTVKLESGILIDVPPTTYTALGVVATNAQMQYTLKNINREAGMQINGSGQAGLFDYTNNKWIVSSPVAGDVLYLNGRVAAYGDVYPFTTEMLSNGTSARRWKQGFINDLVLKPSAIVAPTSNGDLVFEATSNSSVTVKLKGSDGVVRGAVLNLT